jgi:hypothetical protein
VAGRAEQVGRGAVGRHQAEDRPLRGQVFEHLPRQDGLPDPRCTRDQQHQRVGLLHGPQRVVVRQGALHRHRRAEIEPLGPLAVGRAESAHEAHLEHVAQRRPPVEQRPHRLQQRAWAAGAEEVPGVQQAELRRAPVLIAGEVVEVAAVRDRP